MFPFLPGIFTPPSFFFSALSLPRSFISFLLPGISQRPVPPNELNVPLIVFHVNLIIKSTFHSILLYKYNIYENLNILILLKDLQDFPAQVLLVPGGQLLCTFSTWEKNDRSNFKRKKRRLWDL